MCDTTNIVFYLLPSASGFCSRRPVLINLARLEPDSSSNAKAAWPFPFLLVGRLIPARTVNVSG